MPYDASSSYLRGAADAPRVIRQALTSPATGPWAERLIRTVCAETLDDAGDLDLPPSGEARARIEQAIGDLARRRRPFIALGGDHSITYPVLRGLRAGYRPVTLLHIDAHPALNEEIAGDPFSHNCVFARIMEERLAARLIQVGIRAVTGHERDQARRFDVEHI